MAEALDCEKLELEHISGFAGIPNGLKVHPDRQHIIYPLGCTIVIENIGTKCQKTLIGHTEQVSCLTVSNSGCYIASGQRTHMGFKALIIIWSLENGQWKIYKKLELHKVKIEALAFSPGNKFLLSLGGQDDGSVVVWNVSTGEAICGAKAQLESAGNTKCLAFHETDDHIFFTGGDGTLRVWELDLDNRKIRPTDVTLGQVSRNFECIQMNGKYLLCGTTTGDILGVNVESKLNQFSSLESGRNIKKQKMFSRGVTALAHICPSSEGPSSADNPDVKKLLVGSGSGEVALMTYRPKGKKTEMIFEKVKSWCDKNNAGENVAVTSIALRGGGQQFFVGMSNSQIYRFNFADFSCELVKTSHCDTITDIIFPKGSDKVFVTSQLGQLRVWDLQNGKELLRQSVANITCTSVAITQDGGKLYSAWNDGKIRGYTFYRDESGNLSLKLKFTVHEAHSNGVTSLACSPDGHQIISGGGEGQVRIWHVSDDFKNTALEDNLMEHKGCVSDIKISNDNHKCVSSSHDGTTIIWNLDTRQRSQIVFANTLFKCVAFGPSEHHIITSGTDRKITVWDAYDGAKIRELEGSACGSINANDTTEDGQIVVTGGDDKLIKVWDYNTGRALAVGLGHSASIQKIKISPKVCGRDRRIVSVSADGGILVWKFPEHFCCGSHQNGDGHLTDYLQQQMKI